MTEDRPGAAVYGAILAASRAIAPIAKTRRNEAQGFQFRGIDDILNACHGPMTDAGLFAAPELIAEQREERTTRAGGALTWVRLTVRYTVYAQDGSSVAVTVPGEAMDTSDKAHAKAMSVAMRTALIQLFSIPVAGQDDPDYQSHEPAARQPAHPCSPQPTAGAAQRSVPHAGPVTAGNRPAGAVGPGGNEPIVVVTPTGCSVYKESPAGAERPWTLWYIDTAEGAPCSTFSERVAKAIEQAIQQGSRVEIERGEMKYDRWPVTGAVLVEDRPAPASGEPQQQEEVPAIVTVQAVTASEYQHGGASHPVWYIETHNLGRFSCVNPEYANQLTAVAQPDPDGATEAHIRYLVRAKSNLIIHAEEIPF